MLFSRFPTGLCLLLATATITFNDTIAKSLGYRLKMASATLRDAVKPGSSFSGTINLMNVGWGKIYNKRDCELIFRNTETRKEFIVKLTIDPRPQVSDLRDLINGLARSPAAHHPLLLGFIGLPWPPALRLVQ